jgi:hypothetical protein
MARHRITPHRPQRNASQTTLDWIRSKLKRRTALCSPGCLGWGVFNAGTSYASIQSCDACRYDEGAGVSDSDAGLLPEAQKALREADTDYRRALRLASAYED